MGTGIQLVGVSKVYKEKEVVKSVYLDINPGNFMTILGPSGAGKTTLLKMIAGFEKTSDGFIKIDGKDVTALPPYKRNIGMLFQNYALFPHMSVYENIAFPLKLRKLSRKEINLKITTILERVKLTGYEKRVPQELSGGQQQRVALARALVFNPPILLLDEPMSALDKQLRKHMQLEIKELQRELQITTISVTHDQEEALTMATQVCVMKDAQVVQVASPEEIYEVPRSDFVANFLGEANILKGTITKVEPTFALVKLEEGQEVLVPTRSQFFTPGEQIGVMIRPEKLTIAKDTAEDFVLETVISNTVYAGESLRLDLKTLKNTPVKMKLLAYSAQYFTPGDKLKIQAKKENLVLIKPEALA